MSDNTQLPEDLPIIEPDAVFHFECGPEQPCFNRCCSQLNLALTPYDCARLAANMELPSQEFLRMFTVMGKDPQTGFPAFHLRMIDSPEAPCPFVTPAGCSVYEDRPGACRSYPLGRGCRIGKDGVSERFFMVREEHCAGFDCGPAHTPEKWFADPDLKPYLQFSDAYMRLLSLVSASGKPISDKLAGMALLALWQPDNFKKFLQKMKVPDQVQWDGPADFFNDSDFTSTQTALDFALNWLELIIFGQAPKMRRANMA